MFTENNTGFSLEVTPLKSIDILYSELWLVLTGIHEIPPHIALISDGKYYAVSVRKVDCGTPLSRFVNTLERKHIPTLFVKIDAGSTSIDEAQLQSIFSHLQPLKNTGDTCLAPIRNFFATYFSPGYAHIKYVFELLAIAQKQKLIKKCSAIFTNGNNLNRITLQKYTMEQIKDKIHSLSAQINLS